MDVDNSHFGVPLSEQEKSLRDYFVREYIRDFDAYSACLRIGFLPSYATQWSKILMDDGYVKRQILDLTRKPTAENSEFDEDLALITNTLRELSQRGTATSRVAAARAFMTLKGLDKQDNVPTTQDDLVDALKTFAANAPN